MNDVSILNIIPEYIPERQDIIRQILLLNTDQDRIMVAFDLSVIFAVLDKYEHDPIHEHWYRTTVWAFDPIIDGAFIA